MLDKMTFPKHSTYLIIPLSQVSEEFDDFKDMVEELRTVAKADSGCAIPLEECGVLEVTLNGKRKQQHAKLMKLLKQKNITGYHLESVEQ